MNTEFGTRRISKTLVWQSVGVTHQGKVRKLNEDALMLNPQQAHWCVADGMGGHERGDLASQAITKALAEVEQHGDLVAFMDVIDDTLVDVNCKLQTLAGQLTTAGIIGSTVVGLALFQQHIMYYWCGDSRLYRYRYKQLQQLSIDHTQVQDLIDKGICSPQEAHSKGNPNIITRAVGGQSQLYVDFEMAQCQAGDLYLLCSDGVEKELTDEQVQGILATYAPDLEQAAEQLLAAVLAAGARDNVTIVLVLINNNNGTV